LVTLRSLVTSSGTASASTPAACSVFTAASPRALSHAYRAERDQSRAFGLKCGQALFTHEPGADPHVKMQPILDDLAFSYKR
jgi:hypothetical protein